MTADRDARLRRLEILLNAHRLTQLIALDAGDQDAAEKAAAENDRLLDFYTYLARGGSLAVS